MRCARCDRPAIPQALGRDRDGRLVFGWCLDCLEAAGCTEIESVRASDGRPLEAREHRLTLSGPPIRTLPTRRKAMRSIALILSTWSSILMIAGAWALWRKTGVQASPLGNGTPLFLLVGGGSTALTALLLRISATRELEPPC